VCSSYRGSRAYTPAPMHNYGEEPTGNGMRNNIANQGRVDVIQIGNPAENFVDRVYSWGEAWERILN